MTFQPYSRRVQVPTLEAAEHQLAGLFEILLGDGRHHAAGADAGEPHVAHDLHGGSLVWWWRLLVVGWWLVVVAGGVRCEQGVRRLWDVPG